MEAPVQDSFLTVLVCVKNRYITSPILPVFLSLFQGLGSLSEVLPSSFLQLLPISYLLESRKVLVLLRLLLQASSIFLSVRSFLRASRGLCVSRLRLFGLYLFPLYRIP